MFEESMSQGLRLNCLFLAPEIISLLNIKIFPESIYNVMRESVKIAIKHKENPDNRIGDYIDALLEMRKKGPWEGNDGESIGRIYIFITNDFNFKCCYENINIHSCN